MTQLKDYILIVQNILTKTEKTLSSCGCRNMTNQLFLRETGLCSYLLLFVAAVSKTELFLHVGEFKSDVSMFEEYRHQTLNKITSRSR